MPTHLLAAPDSDDDSECMKVAKPNGISHEAHSTDPHGSCIGLVQRHAGVVLPQFTMGWQFQPQCPGRGVEVGMTLQPPPHVDCLRFNPARLLISKSWGRWHARSFTPGRSEQTPFVCGIPIVTRQKSNMGKANPAMSIVRVCIHRGIRAL